MQSRIALARDAVRSPVVLVLLMLGACASDPEVVEEGKDFARPLPEGVPALERVTDPAQIPDMRPTFVQRDRALEALDESLAYFSKPSSTQWFPHPTNDRDITHGDQIRTLEVLRDALVRSESAEEFQGRCLLSFDFYRSRGWDGSGEVLFTAYCEPIFDGRKTPDGTYRHALYGLPADLVKEADGTPVGRRLPDGNVVPYFSRSELHANGHLDGLEIVYLEDPFEVYIAHVQGSARVNLPTGEQLCIGYAGKTDRPYRSIGLRLVEEGRIEDSELSLTTLKRYFRDNPSEVERVLSHNESYVFFTEREPGPFGSIGAKVTPYHNIATDKSVFPRGGPCVVVTSLPFADPSDPSQVVRRQATYLTLDQDTGGAIRSAGRCDLFIGTGDEAERLAGYTREVGQMFYLFVKPQ